MNILKSDLKPLRGVGDLELLTNYNDVKEYLENNGIAYSEEYRSHKGYTSEIPWKIIHISNCISIFFAYDKLWKFYLEEGFQGKLPNGIHIGMDINEAIKIDKTAKFDDWNEIYVSKEGYNFGDSLITGKVASITIAIPEALEEDSENFYSYEWAK